MPLPHLELEIGERVLPHIGGIVDEDVEPAVAGMCALDRRDIAGMIADIDDYGLAFAAIRLDLGEQCIEQLGAARAEYHRGAFRREALRRGAADAGARASEKNDFAIEALHEKVPHPVD